MLFFVFVALIVVGLVVFTAYYNSYKGIMNWDGWLYVGKSAVVIGVSGFIISIVVLLGNYMGINGWIQKNNQRYEILTHQIETKMYNNDNEYGKQELIQKVQNWNEDLASGKANQHDFWIGIYIPNVYDQFEFIDYSSIN